MTRKCSLAWMKYTLQPRRWPGPNVNTGDIDGKQTVENMRAVAFPHTNTLLWPFYVYTHTSCTHTHTHTHTHTPTCRAGWVAVLTQFGLNGHLRWIIVCEWKLGQIISVLLAQGWVRPLSPSLCTYTHTHTCSTHTHTPSLLPLHTYLLTLSVFFTIAPCLFFPSLSLSLHLPLLSPSTTLVSLWFSFFPNNSGLCPVGHSPLSGCPRQCLQ